MEARQDDIGQYLCEIVDLGGYVVFQQHVYLIVEDSEALPEYQAFRSSQDYQFLPRNDKMNPTESTRTTTTTVSTFKFNFNSEYESDDRDYTYDDNERITGYWVTTRSPRYRSPHNPYSSHWGQGQVG